MLFRSSTGQTHEHSLWCSVLDVLSHDLIIDLVDLIGPYYDPPWRASRSIDGVAL